MPTIKEVMELTFPINKHGIKFPIPLEFWPKDVMFATINWEGEIVFWNKKPKLAGKMYLVYGDSYRYGVTEIPEDPSKTFWTRPRNGAQCVPDTNGQGSAQQQVTPTTIPN